MSHGNLEHLKRQQEKKMKYKLCRSSQEKSRPVKARKERSRQDMTDRERSRQIKVKVKVKLKVTGIVK